MANEGIGAGARWGGMVSDRPQVRGWVLMRWFCFSSSALKYGGSWVADFFAVLSASKSPPPNMNTHTADATQKAFMPLGPFS